MTWINNNLLCVFKDWQRLFQMAKGNFLMNNLKPKEKEYN